MSAQHNMTDPHRFSVSVRESVPPIVVTPTMVAALDSLIHHLDMFADSMALEDLWENHPDLTEAEATTATGYAMQFVMATRAALVRASKTEQHRERGAPQ